MYKIISKERTKCMKSRGVCTRRLILLAVSIVLICFMLPGLSSAGNPSWDCPNCGRKGNTGNFCGECAQPSPAPASNPATKPAPKSVKAGDVVSFGHYEQDNNSENGEEAIEWIVLDVDERNNKALLLSKYGLDTKPYNTKLMSITWEKCTLRGWLNDMFLNSAFTAKEQAVILTTRVDNSVSQGYSGWNTKGGNDTWDRLFLLSYAEANRYLGVTYGDASKSGARVAPTAYALAQGAHTSGIDQTADGEPAVWWWLRSPGRSLSSAARVGSGGSLDYNYINRSVNVVRPALWINLESDIF